MWSDYVCITNTQTEEWHKLEAKLSPAPDVSPLLVDLEQAEVLQPEEADDHQEQHLHQQDLIDFKG